MRLYFAHPVNAFGTPIALRIETLIKAFPGIDVESPNQEHHQAGYAVWKKRADASGHKGMNYYYEEVLPHCDGCVALPFLDGKWGRGVAGETKFFLERGQPVFVADGEFFAVRLLTEQEANQLIAEDTRLVLSVEETRARTWGRPEHYGEKKIPYETAHTTSFVHEEWTKENIAALHRW